MRSCRFISVILPVYSIPVKIVLTYDTEEPQQCIPKLQPIFEVHKKFNAPLTIFVVGNLLQEEGGDLKKLIAEAPDLWDVNSHTFSHVRMLPKAPWSHALSSPEEVYEEITRGVHVVRDILDQPCRGFRPRTGSGAGLRGCPTHLDAARTAGCRWTSAYLRSVFADALPGDLSPPFSYRADGFDDLVEMPGHGWQDCMLKQFRDMTTFGIRWPSEHAYPPKLVESPAEEFAVYKVTMDAAAAAGLPFCCMVLHPWTMIREGDPDGKAIELVLGYARERGWGVSTLDAEAEQCRQDPTRLTEAPPIPPTRTPGYDVARHFA